MKMKKKLRKRISVLPYVVKLLSGQVVTFIFHGSIAPYDNFLARVQRNCLNKQTEFFFIVMAQKYIISLPLIVIVK